MIFVVSLVIKLFTAQVQALRYSKPKKGLTFMAYLVFFCIPGSSVNTYLFDQHFASNSIIWGSRAFNIFFAHQKSALFTNNILVSSNLLDGLNIANSKEVWYTLAADTGMQTSALFCFQRAWASLPIFAFVCTISTPSFGAFVFALSAVVCIVWWSVSLHFYTFGAMASICTFEALSICTSFPSTAQRWQTSYFCKCMKDL